MITVTDLFAGAGGSSTGAIQIPGVHVRYAANHWKLRMFRPHEVAAGMAFPADYVWQPVDRAKPVSNRDLVKAAGNAVTPPAARDIIGVAVESITGERAA